MKVNLVKIFGEGIQSKNHKTMDGMDETDARSHV